MDEPPYSLGETVQQPEESVIDNSPEVGDSVSIDPERRRATLSEYLDIALAMLFPALLMTAWAMACFIRWIDSPGPKITVEALTAAWVILAPLELAAGLFLKRRLDRYPAVTVDQVAIEQPSWPLALRPIVAIFWVAHSVAAVWAAGVYADMLRGDAAYTLPLVTTVFPIAARLVAAYASNLYLLLALGALVRRRHLLRQAWKARLLSDVLLVVAVHWIPLLHF
ncbi:MAG TPA: hypothetical protein VFW23_14620 [Tepidisphaeraceae bacterium]|nr:hypothetical protein [Tepidisphaeraceae bacterium]